MKNYHLSGLENPRRPHGWEGISGLKISPPLMSSLAIAVAVEWGQVLILRNMMGQLDFQERSKFPWSYIGQSEVAA